MAIRFNLDGSITEIPEPTEQEFLETRLNNFNQNKERQFENLRNYRIATLKETDWAILPDSPLSVGIQSHLKNYRQALRDLPSHPNAPDRFLISDWPLAPGQSEIPQEAKVFIAEISDPVGIGTTSWVGINEDGEYVDLMPPPPEPEPIPGPETEESL